MQNLPPQNKRPNYTEKLIFFYIAMSVVGAFLVWGMAGILMARVQSLGDFPASLPNFNAVQDEVNNALKDDGSSNQAMPESAGEILEIPEEAIVEFGE